MVERSDIEDMRWCDGECGHAGMVAVVSASYCGDAHASYYCDDAEHVHEPSAEEVAAEEAFVKRAAVLEAYQDHVLGFVKAAWPKFPGKGHASLRQWAHEMFEARYGCELDEAWAGFKEPRGKALDQFVLMRTVPECVPCLSSHILEEGYQPWAYDVDDILSFTSFHDDVLVVAGFEDTPDERELMERLREFFAADEADEDVVEEAWPEGIDDDEPPFDADEVIEPVAMAA